MTDLCDGSTPLHMAWKEKVISLLLEHGAKATAQTTDGLTLLHLACEEKVVRLLINYGADITARTKHGSTPLHMAWNEEVVGLHAVTVHYGGTARFVRAP